MNKTIVIRAFILFLFLLYTFHSYSQQNLDTSKTESETPRNIAFAEIFGHGRGWISANYERIFKFPNKHFLYTIRAGVAYALGYTDPVTRRNKGVVTFPLVASLLAGGKVGYAQLSLGYSYSFSESFIDSTANPPYAFQKYEPAYSISLGYRYIGSNIVVSAYPILIWTNNPIDRFSVGFGVFMGARF